MTTRLVAILIIVVAVISGIYMLADDTPEAWVVRLSFAGAITAGAAVTIVAIETLTRRP